MVSLSQLPECENAGDVMDAPAWMGRLMLAAAVYNLVWGGLAVTIPRPMLDFLGFNPPPLYPELWQCIGMIVGVYGLGYAIAARDVVCHWPIVLVGLLGKVFGPIGFVSAVLAGRLPVSMGWMIVTNDLIWWIPFSMILWRAAQIHQSQGQRLIVTPPTRPFDAIGRMISHRGATIAELSRRSPLLLVFLRHSGCTFCREALADLSDQRKQIEASGTTIAIVHLGQQEPHQLLQKYNLTDLHSFRDPCGTLYSAYGLKLGSVRQLMGARVWLRGAKSVFSGHGFGRLEGNAFRMPGVFLIRHNEIVRCFRHSSAADRPNYVNLANAPDHMAPQGAAHG